MKVKNDSAASAAGHTWAPGEEVEVDDDLAAELIAIQDGGFYNPADHPDGFSGRPRHIGPEGPGPTTKQAEWPTEGDDPVKDSTTKESEFAVNPDELKPKARRKRATKKVESEVDPDGSQSEVDPAADERDAPDDAA